MQLDYLLIGHFSKDIYDKKEREKYSIGGGVFYSGITAKKLGAKVKVLTSFSKDLIEELNKKHIFKEFEIRNILAKFTTTFQNIYHNGKRTQFLYHKAKKISSKFLPQNWYNPSIVQIAPIIQEVNESILKKFKNSLIGATLQGWLRKRSKNKQIIFNPWKSYKRYLPLINVAILSEEDVNFDFKLIKEFSKYSNILVLTQGKKGCTVFTPKKIKQFKPKKIIKKEETTGAGDVFAAAYLITFKKTRNPWKSAESANSLTAFHLENNIYNNRE